jgi:two-component system cell cycle sensor histidine kinase/response regulator CckA
MNLVVNASDAMPDGGELTITVNTRDEQQTEIVVADTGKGMSASVIGHIFEPFFTTKPDAGTGMGLSASLGIVEQHGGKITVESNPRRGSTFTILLQSSIETTPTTHQPAPAAPTLGSGLKILVAEDDVDVRKVLELFLERHGYQPFIAQDAQHALHLMESNTFDLLISDVIMPDMKGPELYAAALRKQPDLKVLFVSGYTEDVLTDLQRSGVTYAYLPKPFSISQLSGAIAEVVSSNQ